jgi:fused signal recognition particle receptor
MGNLKKIFNKQKVQSLNKGLEVSKRSFFNKLTQVLVGKTRVDDDVLDELEEVLISSDVGVETTLKIIDRLEERVQKDKYSKLEDLAQYLREEISDLLKSQQEENTEQIKKDELHVIMVVGVNGVGKTTTIGKIAHQLQGEGKKVILGAGDTFRAAASDQLKTWAERVNCEIVTSEPNTDPSSVAFETLQVAVAKKADVVLLDTAGRLHNKVNLMNELSKIKRVMSKVIPDAPHEVLLVLDGSTGQNAFAQAKAFTNATEVSGLAITKLDGTAKGGVVIGISDQFQIPVQYIGVGEGIEDLQQFDAHTFVNSFFSL